jgi:hypothetical protein
MAMTPTELALRTALANPSPAIEFIDRLLGEQLEAAITEMSIEERAYLSEMLDRRIESGPAAITDDDRAVLYDLAERRERGEQPTTEQRRECRRIEGWWTFSRSLRNLARQNGLPLPDYSHGLNAYREQVARELLAKYSWTVSNAGEPLDAWEDADLNAMHGSRPSRRVAALRVAVALEEAFADPLDLESSVADN